MKTRGVIFIVLSLLCVSCTSNNQTIEYPVVERSSLTIFPEILYAKPDMPSPVITPDGREFVLVSNQDGQYSWIDATIENGDDFNYKNNLHGKGKQLTADSVDFPHFAKYGWHSDKELSQTTGITGRSVSQITIDGRPWGSSGVGFMTEDETILSVIWGDNQIAKKLGLKHPEISSPLFHIWNAGWMMGQVDRGFPIKKIFYNNREIDINMTGSRGWQESIFNDEILGSGHINIHGPIGGEDNSFLDDHYQDFSGKDLDSLKNMLSHIRTGNMVLYYINRYGFYEGRNEYKPDPLVIAYIFGLKSLEEIHGASGGNLFKYLTTPHTENPPYKDTRRKTQDARRKTQDVRKVEGTSNSQPATRNPQQSTVGSRQSAVKTDQSQIDSLVKVLAAAGRNWNIPAEKLIAIGDPAVPALVELLLDKSESQWNRRVAAMTLNQIHSPVTVETGIKFLLDENEMWELRNHIIPSLRGFDLSSIKDELWDLYNKDYVYKGNVAGLLETADTALAYKAYREIFHTEDGYGQMQALRHLARLRPHEATAWYMKGLVNDDWMTGNMVMDSLVNLKNLDANSLLELFDKEDTNEETRWRIVRVLGQLDLPESTALLEKARKDTSWLIKMEAIFNLNQVHQTN